MRGFIAQDKNTVDHYFIGSSRDITREKLQEEFPEERAQKDPLTGVYNRFFGKELIDEYLASRNPCAGCEQKFCEGVDIDARYLHNDIVSSASEIFEKMSSFQAAIELLMKVIGLKFRLNRITVLHTIQGPLHT